MSRAAIGVLGGSFNPPHEGHRALVEHALRRLKLSGMRVLVTPQNPLKDARDYAPLEERLEATRRMMRGLPQVRVEAEAQTGPVFTIDTLSQLVSSDGGTRYLYVMGADSFADLHRWHRWRDLMGLVPIVVVNRPGHRLEARNCPAARAFAAERVPERDLAGLRRRSAPAWGFLGGLSRPESSTAIREART